MKLLVWHWGRRGAGPRFAAELAAGVNTLAGWRAALSLAADAEILRQEAALECVWQEPTYQDIAGYFWQKLAGGAKAKRAAGKLAALRPDFAICAMPALLDSRMVAALGRQNIGYGVIVHEARAHLGDDLPFRLMGQARLLAGAKLLMPLSKHVETELRALGYGRGVQRVARLWHPPFNFGPDMKPPLAHKGKPRLLYFGRLLPYKGLDLLAEALSVLGPDLPFSVRVCGEGPHSPALARLQAMADVQVQRGWVPEDQISILLAWADALVLPYREASQSGVAAAAVAHGRYVLATGVGGLAEQLAGVERAVICQPQAEAIASGLRALRDLMAAHAETGPRDAGRGWGEMAARLTGEIRAGGWLPK